MLKLRYIICTVILLSLQLGTAVHAKAFSLKHPLTVWQKLQAIEASEDFVEDVAEQLQITVDNDDEDIPDRVHDEVKRRKTKYYLSATNQQYSIANRVTYLDTDTTEYSINLADIKSGSFLLGKPLKPAYYSFLFRFTPF
ncbi:hypothetical protein [Chitinophaga sp. Cy-1792]|uniref:hypothetical protein n=1 Tax=Chitinophaga sp. Cy-1792 TaxID=2608339 RepID=UPI00141E041D|nr:hypothetical protein [Chitinophaga sp. Cy-1792]NIG57346.1 hypothetical protein [Chitinophaga sp. Cy-1792]